MELTKKFLIFCLFFLLCITTVSAQSASGSLSINPSTFTLTSQGAKTTLSVVYTGADMQGAEVYLTLGSGLKINSFTVGTGLTKLYESTTTNEFHVGSLDTITSGQTLFTFEVEATSCSQSGQVGFNSTNTLVPDVTLTFNGSSYTINCTGATTTPTPTNTPVITSVPYTPTTLPQTAFGDNSTDIILGSVGLFGTGAIVWLLLVRLRTNKQDEDIKIIVMD